MKFFLQFLIQKPLAIIFTFALCMLETSVYSQSKKDSFIEGNIWGENTKVPVVYANVYNKSLNKGTLSNESGYFRLPVDSDRDTIYIFLIGYERKQLQLRRDQAYYLIYLRESYRQLREVTVVSDRGYALYDLLHRCRKRIKYKDRKAKAYFELKSYVNDYQVELMESYYNVDVKGYDVDNLYIKNSRFAIRPFHNRIFQSFESSKAVTYHKTFKSNTYFPFSPMELSRSQLVKNYELRLESRYREDGDSIYVLSFTPYHKTGSFFEGMLWINKTKKQLLKIHMQAETFEQHPFLPFPGGDISKITFDITKTFREIDGEMYFNHVDFTYYVDYRIRQILGNGYPYSVKTKALFYAYDYGHSFNLPRSQSDWNSKSDYVATSQIPYNPFFWSYNDEYSLKDSLNRNEDFFIAEDVITNVQYTYYNSQRIRKLHLKTETDFDFFIHWTGKRLLFHNESRAVKNEKTHFAIDVNVYMDVDEYRDSLHIITSTVFDPAKSYNRDYVDTDALCFMNIYFDLVEIERRKFMERVSQQGKNVELINLMYNRLSEHLFVLKKDYMKSVDYGRNKKELQRWNDYVVSELGIDNIRFFGELKRMMESKEKSEKLD